MSRRGCQSRAIAQAFASCVLVIMYAGSTDAAQVTWRSPIEVAVGPAFQGPWRMNRSKFHYVDDPTVAISKQGDVGVAWADNEKLDIFLQVYASDGRERFQASVNVSRTPETFSWLPRMVISEGDPISIYALWQEIVFSGGSHGGEIFFARSRDGGRTFNGPINLSNSVPGDGKGRLSARRWDNGSLDLAVGPTGNLFAAWTEYDGALWICRSVDAGESFSKPRRIADIDDSKPARGPSLAVDANNVVYLAWTVGEDLAADIRVARSTDGGRSFDVPRLVSTSEGHSDAPKLRVDRKGVVHLVYAERAAGSFDRYHVRYTRSVDGADTFDNPLEISYPHPDRFDSASFPSLSRDGRDDLYLLFDLFARSHARPRGLGFTVLSGQGRTLVAPLVVPGTHRPQLGGIGSRQGLLMRKLAVNSAGDVAVVNSTFKRNERSSIWLIRGRRASR